MLIALVAFALVSSCSKISGQMTPEDFLKIQSEVFSTDLTPESTEAIVKKYNYTLKQYEDFSQKVESDPDLKAKIGEIKLKNLQGGSK
jgi:hypothetical protein